MGCGLAKSAATDDIYIRMGENLYVYFGFPTKICNFTAAEKPKRK